MKQHTAKISDEYPYWLWAVAVLGGLVFAVILFDQNYLHILTILSGGIQITIWVTIISFVPAAFIGVLVALMRNSRSLILKQFATLYVQIVRGIPLLVLLFYVAFVAAPAITLAVNWLTTPLQQLNLLPAITVRNFDLTWRAVLALVICYSAFLSEIIRAGIEAVPKGQIEAARALGLSKWQILRMIIAPQAVRIAFPPLGNQFVSMVKDSSLVSVLGVQDVAQLANTYSSATYDFFSTYNILTIIYLIIVLIISAILNKIENQIRFY